MQEEPRAEKFIEKLSLYQSEEERQKMQRYFKTGAGEYGEGDQFLGVRMGQVFQLAKEMIDMPPAEIEKLLDSSLHEVRAGGLSIMDKQARRKTRYAATMPRTVLRYALEKHTPEQRAHYMGMKKKAG